MSEKTTSNVQPEKVWKVASIHRGIMALCAAAGGVTALAMKRRFWGVVGFMFLGSVLGSGAAFLITRNELKPEATDESTSEEG